MFYVTFTCALCWGNLALKEWAEKWHQLCWFVFVFLSFFRWNKPGCRRPSSAESLLRPPCQINFMLLLPKQPWHMCDFWPVWNWLQCEFRRGKKGGRSEHCPEITNSPAVWPSISIDGDFFLLRARSCLFVQSLDMCVRLISHIWRDGRVSCVAKANHKTAAWNTPFFFFRKKTLTLKPHTTIEQKLTFT